MLSNNEKKLVGEKFAREFDLDYEKVKGAIEKAPPFTFGLELESWLTQNMGIMHR